MFDDKATLIHVEEGASSIDFGGLIGEGADGFILPCVGTDSGDNPYEVANYRTLYVQARQTNKLVGASILN